jgi:dihydroorotate dehydrogenase
MGRLYQHAVKPALFRLDPERAHELAVDALALLGRVRPLCALLERCTSCRRKGTGRSSASG